MTLNTLLAGLATLHEAEFCTYSHDASLAVLELYDPDPESDWSIGLNVDEHDPDEELRADLRWDVTGWLTDVLEARGCRKGLVATRDGRMYVQVCTSDGEPLDDWGGEGEDELEALVEACLAMAADG